ncbi:hypothetical protein SAMN02983003_0479 [Devosia enhydra]|uniref:Uncharacterized protein n=1 Tax=Devosia enhydra TaxID=665118 RepID=A0A1K2HTN8_9HYPH|nr:hypothetical protein [Devosia enhydra]SFZ81401.1 hypothetical protein SAMN02983003_0479 [Devosia enhydra]
MKPYMRWAYGLILFGLGLFMLERFGLSTLSGPQHAGVHLDPNLLSAMVIAPIALVFAGCIVFMVGKMRRY